MPSWEYSASMSLRAAARAVMRPPSLKNTTPIALKELRSVSWSKSFMTATKFTVAFLCRLPIIDGRTTMKALFFSPAFCLITSLITACSSPSGPNAWTPVTSGPPRAPIPQNEVLVIDEYPMGEYTNVGHFNGPEGRIVHVSMEDKELIDYFTKEAAAMGGQYRRHQGTAHPLPFRRRQEQPGGRHLCSGRNGNTRCGRPGHGLAPH